MGGVSPETCTHPGMEETVTNSVNASVSEAAQKIEDESSSQAQQSTLITSDIAIANPKDNAMEKVSYCLCKIRWCVYAVVKLGMFL